MRARQLLASICQESAPAPTTAPRPTTTPTKRPERRSRPGTKPWKIPSIKPGEHTAPKAYMEARDLDVWIENWADNNRSAVNLWGSTSLVKAMHAAAEAGKTLKSVSWDSDDKPQGESKVAALLKLGWRELGRERNFQSNEVILAK